MVNKNKKHNKVNIDVAFFFFFKKKEESEGGDFFKCFG